MCDLESLRGIFGDLLMRVCLSVLLLIVCGSAIARLAKATGRPIGALWRKSRSIFVALALLACCTTLDAEKTECTNEVRHLEKAIAFWHDIHGELSGKRLDRVMTQREHCRVKRRNPC